jgi:hypothetical protein
LTHRPEPSSADDAKPYARCIEASRRIRWDIDADVIRGRSFNFNANFLPEGLARATGLALLDATDRRLLNQIEGRTYANMFGLVERFIAAKILEVGHDHALGNQVALEALVKFTDEELKHQELFRRIDQLMSAGMPAGYQFTAQADDVARAVLATSTWAVLALTCHIELFTQVHYRHSIHDAAGLSTLYKDVFLFHWKEESQHAVLDELEWRREDSRLSVEQRDKSVDQFIDLLVAVDSILQAQAVADARYFSRHCSARLSVDERTQVQSALLADYRWQYIVSGAQDPRFGDILRSLVTAEQWQRVQSGVESVAG